MNHVVLNVERQLILNEEKADFTPGAGNATTNGLHLHLETYLTSRNGLNSSTPKKPNKNRQKSLKRDTKVKRLWVQLQFRITLR